MELKSTNLKKSRAKEIPADPIENLEIDNSRVTDISQIVEQSKTELLNAPTKRKRRTRAELQADPNFRSKGISGATVSNIPNQAQGINPIQRDRTQELKPAFELYSDLFLAKPLEIPELKFSETEAENLARVTSDLMNAFPEYFNQADPKVAALISAALVAAPIGYVKYKIYSDQMKKREKKNEPKT